MVRTDPFDGSVQNHNEGQGRRLTQAFEAVAAYPVSAQAVRALTTLFEGSEPEVPEVTAIVEADIALSIGVLRLANRVQGAHSPKINGIFEAVERVTPYGVLQLARRGASYDFFERGGVWQGIQERFRLHAVNTQRAADRIAVESGFEDRGVLQAGALLHDIGKLVLIGAYPNYPRRIDGFAQTPEDRLRVERRELGIDHALVGGVIARRLGLPTAVTNVIESHHSQTPNDAAAILELADGLAHYGDGSVVSPSRLSELTERVGLSADQLRALLYELPVGGGAGKPRQIAPCPMSTREVEVLRGLAKGMVYKQIATEMGLSTSTVRTHLHNVYGKLGVMDRAQAVLIATERGWI